jgi:hypothetical protein
MRHLALLTLLMGGCTWVTSGDLDCQLQLVDDDGDGYPLSEVEAGYEGNDRCNHLVPVDCDDGDAGVYPGAEDAFYDGIDADCALDDDFDQDLDGYVLDEYEGAVTEGVDGTGQLPGGDCDDEAISIFPGSNDLAYDGIDSDCSGNDDYDQDGDGYVPSEYEGLSTTYVDGTGELPGGDCDDTTIDVNPAQTDAWYDGVDTDCSGNDDYDQDRDGYVPDDYIGLGTTYVDGSGALPGGDCDDTERTIHAGASDAWYDGIDSDCMGDDDYDQDLDGHRDAATTKDGDDCDDLDDTTYLGAVETFGDGIDHDCDGASETFGLSDVEDLSWVSPQSLLFASTGTELFLGATAEQFTLGSTNLYDSAVAVVFDMNDPAAGYGDSITWVRNFSDPAPNVLTPGCDLYPTADILYGSVGIATGNSRQFVLRAWDRAASSGPSANPPITADLSFEDISIAVDGDGNLHAVGCTETEHDHALAYMWAQPDTLAGNGYDDHITLSTRARTCDLDFFAANGDGALILTQIESVGGTSDTGDTGAPLPASEEVSLVVYTFAAPGGGGSTSFVNRGTIGSYEPQTVQVFEDGPRRLLVLAEPGRNVISVISVDSMWRDSEVYTVVNRAGTLTRASSTVGADGMLYVLATNDLGELRLYYGLPGVMTSMQEVEFDPGIMVDETAIYADPAGAYLFMAASGYDPTAGIDRVVWGYAALIP